jgi:hypothetical protein
LIQEKDKEIKSLKRLLSDNNITGDKKIEKKKKLIQKIETYQYNTLQKICENGGNCKSCVGGESVILDYSCFKLHKDRWLECRADGTNCKKIMIDRITKMLTKTL